MKAALIFKDILDEQPKTEFLRRRENTVRKQYLVIIGGGKIRLAIWNDGVFKSQNNTWKLKNVSYWAEVPEDLEELILMEE